MRWPLGLRSRAGQWGTRRVAECVSGAKETVVGKSGLGVQEETIGRFPSQWFEPVDRGTGGADSVGAMVPRSTRRRGGGGGHVMSVEEGEGFA